MNKREKKILSIVRNFSNKLPKFSDGRIDYSSSETAPIITVFIKYKDKILLLKRSNKVSSYQGKWNTVSGYLDDFKSLRAKAIEEVNEELGVTKNNILSFHLGKFYKLSDIRIHKVWLVHPVLIKLKNKPDIKLDWEHTEYRWIKKEELKNFDTIYQLNKSLENISE